MKLDEIKYSIISIFGRRLRSSLTIISILIGITAIFSLVSFGLGIHNYVNALADEAGRDKLFIQAKSLGAPGTDKNFYLTKDDLEFVGKIKGVNEIAGMYFMAGEAEFDEQKRYQFVIGLDPDEIDFILETFAIDIIEGRDLKDGDSNKAVLGYNYRSENKIFKKAVKLRDKIIVNGDIFEVIGFFEEVGNPQDDAQIYILPESILRLNPSVKDKYGFIMLEADKGTEPGELAEKIKDKLRKHKGQEEGKEDFYVQTFEDALETFGTIINVINGVLVLIALISLVVASVNIMNTMYTAVLERTREIGVMKAVGAKNEEIMFIFVFESGFLGFLGGFFGVLLGYFISSIGGKIAAAAGFALLKPIFPWYLTTGCMLFAFLVGAGSGFLPALQASKQKPVDALRYE